MQGQRQARRRDNRRVESRRIAMERNKYSKIILSEAEQQWMRDNFCNTKNAEIAAYLGISPRTVVRIARDMGLVKHPDFTKAMQRNASEHGARVNRANGGNAGTKNLLLYGKAYRFKKGERQRIKCRQKPLTPCTDILASSAKRLSGQRSAGYCSGWSKRQSFGWCRYRKRKYASVMVCERKAMR